MSMGQTCPSLHKADLQIPNPMQAAIKQYKRKVFLFEVFRGGFNQTLSIHNPVTHGLMILHHTADEALLDLI